MTSMPISFSVFGKGEPRFIKEKIYFILVRRKKYRSNVSFEELS
jgi:hypothetical protein